MTKKLTGEARKLKATEMAKAYRAGASIRALAKAEGKSYAFAYRLLTVDAMVTLRTRRGTDQSCELRRQALQAFHDKRAESGRSRRRGTHS